MKPTQKQSTTTRAEKALPRARVMYRRNARVFHPESYWPYGWGGGSPAAVIPCPTRAQAARIAKVANMTEGERLTLARDAYFGVTNNPTDPDAMLAVLASLGLATGGKA